MKIKLNSVFVGEKLSEKEQNKAAAKTVPESERGRPSRQVTFSRILQVAAGRVFVVHRREQVVGELAGKGVNLIC